MENIDNPAVTQSDAKQSQMSFGFYLKKARLEKGLTIDDIMDHTRISKFMIQQIETENRELLPEDVYLKGFLKAYAEVVGVDPFDVLERYKKSMGRNNEAQAVAAKRDGMSPKSRTPVKVFAAVLILLALLGGTLFLTTVKEPAMGPETQAVPVETPEVFRPVEPGDAVLQETTGLHLEVVCVEATTLKISTDGGVPEEYVLKPEDHLELKAENTYNILMDNTCGVTLFLNNNPVTVPGKCGQTANIQLP